MTDLWVEATHDFDREESDRSLVAAREAVVDLWPFLASASNQEDFENRKALIVDRLDAAAQGETRQRLEAALDQDFAVVVSQRRVVRPKGRTAADQKLRVHEDPGGGVSARWVVQYYDSEKGMWFDKGDGVPTSAEAEEKLRGFQSEGSHRTAGAYDEFGDWKYDDAQAVITKLKAIDGYDEPAILEAIKGIGYNTFQVLDEKPGYFGNYYDEDWHWKLRRARNSAEGFFEALGPRNAVKTASNVVGDACPGRDAEAGATHSPGVGKSKEPPFKCIFCQQTIKAASTEGSRKTAAGYANYGWIVTEETTDVSDVEWERVDGRGQKVIPKAQQAVEVFGPRNIHPKVMEALKAGKGAVFGLWSDDGIRDCKGRWIEVATDISGVDVSEIDTGWGGEGDPLGDYGGNYGSAYLTDGRGQIVIGSLQKQAERHTDSTTGIVGEWRVDVAGVGESTWSNNAVTWDTQEEANRAASDLMSRWMGADMARVVPSSTPKKETIDPADPYIVENWRKSGSRRQAWTEDMSDVSYMAEKLMSLTGDAAEGVKAAPGSTGDAEMKLIEDRLVEMIKPLAADITDDDQRILEDYNFHITNRAIDRAKGTKKFSRKTAADVGDTECTNCGTFFDQAEVKARDNIPGGATTEFCTQNCYDEYYGPDPTALDVYEGRRKTADTIDPATVPFGPYDEGTEFTTCATCGARLIRHTQLDGDWYHHETGLQGRPETTDALDPFHRAIPVTGSRGSARRHPFGLVGNTTKTASKVQVFINEQKDEVGRNTGWSEGYRPGDAMRFAVSYNEDGTVDEILDRAYERFNIGTDDIAKEYRAGRNRSLSVGDVINVDDVSYAVDFTGWKPVGFVTANRKIAETLKERFPNLTEAEKDALGNGAFGLPRTHDRSDQTLEAYYTIGLQIGSSGWHGLTGSRKQAAAIIDEDPENNTMTTEQGVWTMEYDSESMKRMKEADDYEPWFPEFPNEAEWSQPHHYKLTGPKGQVHEFSAQGDSVAGPWYSAWEQARHIVSQSSLKTAQWLDNDEWGADYESEGIGEAYVRPHFEVATDAEGVSEEEQDGWDWSAITYESDTRGAGHADSKEEAKSQGQKWVQDNAGGAGVGSLFSRKTAQAGPPEPWPESACGEQDEDTFCIRDTGHEGEHQFRSRFWIEQKMDEAGLTSIEEELPEEGEEQAEEVAPEEAPPEQPAENGGEAKPKGEVPPQFKKKTSRPKADLSKVAEEEPRICQDCGYPLNEPTPDANCMKHPPERTAGMRKVTAFVLGEPEDWEDRVHYRMVARGIGRNTPHSQRTTHLLERAKQWATREGAEGWKAANDFVYGSYEILEVGVDAEPFLDANREYLKPRTSMLKGAPFADYKDFADCVSKNQQADDPEAYCGYIKHKVEDTKESILIASALLPRLTNSDFEQATEELSGEKQRA